MGKTKVKGKPLAGCASLPPRKHLGCAATEIQGETWGDKCGSGSPMSHHKFPPGTSEGRGRHKCQQKPVAAPEGTSGQARPTRKLCPGAPVGTPHAQAELKSAAVKLSPFPFASPESETS